MIRRDINENFKVVVSTKKTLMGASASEFAVYYANVNDLGVKTIVAGGAVEAVTTIASGSEHTATTTAEALVGANVIYVNAGASTLEEGETIEYATGLYAYITKIVADKVYLKTALQATIAVGATLTQAGNTGEYTTADIAIASEGEYIVAIEASDFGILVEQRIKVADATVSTTTDADAPTDTVAVAY